MERGRKELPKMDNIVHIFEENHPWFVVAFRAARVIVHAGQRHNGAKKDNEQASSLQP